MKTRCVISIMVLGAFIFLPQAVLAGDVEDLEELKAIHMMLIKAGNTGDMETLFKFVDDHAIRFGAMRGIPHVIRGKEHKERVKQLYAKFYETHVYFAMWHKPDYRVIGNTGLIWGLVEETRISKKSGITQRSFLKVSQTFVKSDDPDVKWLFVLGHYTPIPQTQTLY